MAKDNKDPFNPYVQELQGQEGDIEKKIEIIKEITKEVKLSNGSKTKFEEAQEKLKKLKKEIAEKKIEDLEEELEDLEKLIEDPKIFVPPKQQPPAYPKPPWWPPFWPWPPGAGSSSSASSSSNSGAVDDDKMIPQGASTVTIGTAEREYIVARSRDKVWVWHPSDLRWVAQLDTGGEIIELAKVDGTISVRTASSLWLFHPIDYRWMGQLNESIESVSAYTLSVPAVIKKDE